MSNIPGTDADAEGETSDLEGISGPSGRLGFGLTRETRFGLAAMLSFLVLVTVLVWNKNRFGTNAKKKDPAAGGLASASKLPRMEIDGGSQSGKSDGEAGAQETPPAPPAAESPSKPDEAKSEARASRNEPKTPGKERLRKDSGAPAERAEYTVTQNDPAVVLPPTPAADAASKDASARSALDAPLAAAPATAPSDTNPAGKTDGSLPAPTPVAVENPAPGGAPSSSDPPLPTPVGPPPATAESPAALPPTPTPSSSDPGRSDIAPPTPAPAPSETSQTGSDRTMPAPVNLSGPAQTLTDPAPAQAPSSPTPPPTTPAPAGESTPSGGSAAANEITPPGKPIPDIITNPATSPATAPAQPAAPAEPKAEDATSSLPRSSNPAPAPTAVDGKGLDSAQFVELPTIGKGRSLDDDPFAVEPTPAPAPPERVEPETTTAGSGSVVPPSRKPAAKEADRLEPVPHVVQRGENFWTISQYFYGSGRFYKALWAANRRAVPKIDQLFVGQTIQIPPPEDLDHSLVEPARTAATSPTSGSTIAPVRKASRPGATEVDLPASDPFAYRESGAAGRQADGLEAEPGSDPIPGTRYRPRGPLYKVAANETLRSIARDTLGTSRRASEILALNREVIDDPTNLVVGQILRLPDDARVGRRKR